MCYTSKMSGTCPTVEISQGAVHKQKKSQHNRQYYYLHKQQCFRKSLIYDIRKSGRIPKREVMKRYDLKLDEFIQLFCTWAVNRSLTLEKKEALAQLVVQYFD